MCAAIMEVQPVVTIVSVRNFVPTLKVFVLIGLLQSMVDKSTQQTRRTNLKTAGACLSESLHCTPVYEILVLLGDPPIDLTNKLLYMTNSMSRHSDIEFELWLSSYAITCPTIRVFHAALLWNLTLIAR